MVVFCFVSFLPIFALSVSLCPFVSLLCLSLGDYKLQWRKRLDFTNIKLFFFLHFVWAWNIHTRGGEGGGGGNESQDPINVLFLWVFAGVLGDVYLLGVFF